MIPLIQLENIAKSFGDRKLYENISFAICEGDRISLIAPNGAGKTTLLRIISGEESADTGRVTFKNDIKVGFLSQEPNIDKDLTLLEAIFASDTPQAKVVREYEEALINNDIERLSTLNSEMDTHGGWSFESKAKAVLSRLKIDNLSCKVGSLSGGQLKRLSLAVLLIDDPEVLILDEPTNHLDLEMSEWLEDYLINSGKTLFMVTHDRYFLDRVCTRTLEIDHSVVYSYDGGYNEYMVARDERIKQFGADVDKAQNLYRTELEWMRRMPQARGTKAKYRKDAFEEVKERAHRRRDDSELKIGISSSRLGTKIFEINHLNKSFGDIKIINDFSYTFSRYEKMGLVGKNGAGKSTFLNMLTGAIPPDKGVIEIGSTVKFGYYRQSGMVIDETKKVIDVAREVADVVTLGDGSTLSVSQFLTQFLFPPKQQQQFVAKLSGGERRRLYLLTILMQSPNFLILDEPTNDLDVITLNVLEEYLMNFSGCVLVVSHDRYFMDKVVDNLLLFEGEGVLRTFAGNYTEYRNSVIDAKQQEKETIITAEPKKAKETVRAKKLSYKEQRELESLDKELPILEEEKNSIEEKLSNGTASSDEIMTLSKRYEEIKDELEEKEMRWLELSEI